MRNSLKSDLVSVLGTCALLLGSSCNKSMNNEVYDNLNDKDIFGFSKDKERIGGEEYLNDKDIFGFSKDKEKVMEDEYIDPYALLSIQKFLSEHYKSLLSPNRLIKDFPGIGICFNERKGDTLYNLLIFEGSDKDSREFRAETAEIKDGENGTIFLSMENVQVSPFPPGGCGVATVRYLNYYLPNLRLASSNNNSRVGN